MATSQSTSTSSLPQGFSVYQPTLGAQLQFLPAIGTQELDEMINSFLPGPASIQDKRTAVSIDFLEYASATGQTFKFYPVYSLSASPLTQSPVADSVSSFNASPVASNWDFSRVSSQSSNARQSRKPSPSTRTSDFSHIPGMKIMTKEGVDVTNQASRGSKTKEQRDHAHLMRIIKACDACKRKKVRCDPSHKKRGAAAPTSSQTGVATSSRVSKKVKVSENRNSPAIAVPAASNTQTLVSNPSLSFDFDASFGFDPTASTLESWEDFVQFPAEEEMDEDYNFFEDPHGYFSPVDSSLSSLGTASTNSPVFDDDENRTLAVPRTGTSSDLLAQAGTPSDKGLPYEDRNSSMSDYIDFNLFSPQSDFSEDEHMIALTSSSVSQASVNSGESSNSNTGQLRVRQSPLGDMLPQACQSELHAPHDSRESSLNSGFSAQVSSEYYTDGDDQSHDPGRGLIATSPASSMASSFSSLPSLCTATSSVSSASSVSLEIGKMSPGDAQMTGSSVSRHMAGAIETITTSSSGMNTGVSTVQEAPDASDVLMDAAHGPRMIAAEAFVNIMATVAATVCQTAFHLATTAERNCLDIDTKSQSSFYAQSHPMVACA